jgi:hypothetical protein
VWPPPPPGPPLGPPVGPPPVSPPGPPGPLGPPAGPPPGPPPGQIPAWDPYGRTSTADTLFFGVELDFVGTAVKNRLKADVTRTDGVVDTLTVPAANLDWTVSPRFEVGYRLPECLGALSVSYRFLATEGNATLAGTDPAEHVRSRVNVNVFDFDYSSTRFSPIPHYDLKYILGIRLASLYFDSQLQDPAFFQRSSNYLLGAGPHAALEVDRRIALVPGLALLGKIDGAVVIGRVKQNFAESVTNPDGSVATGGFSQRKTRSVPELELELGLSYTPPSLSALRFSTGYVFKRWFDLGNFNESRGELTTQGVFLRAEVDF